MKTEPWINKTCKTCKFKVGNSESVCRKYPPVVKGSGKLGLLDGYPKVSTQVNTEGCIIYQPACSQYQEEDV